MTPAEQLRAAKALIDTPEKWTKGAYARDKSGRSVAARTPFATCFCTLGAFLATTGSEVGAYGLRPLLPADRKSAPSIAEFNDDPSTTHADIMKLFDDAIALAEAAQ